MISHRQLKDILSSLSTSSQSCFSKSSSIRIEACPINDELAAWPLAENVSHPLRTLLQLQTGFIIIAKKGKNSVDCACVKIVPEDAGQTSQEFEFPSLDRGVLCPVGKDAARQFLSQCIQLSEVRSQSRFSMIWPVFVLCSTGTREKLSYLGLSMGRMQPDTPLSVISVESCGIATEHTIPFSAASLVHDFMDAKRAFDKWTAPLTLAFAKYNILESTEPNASSVSLDTTWDSVQKLLSAPSFVTSMTMRISYVPGTVDTENHTQTQRLRTELEKLNCLHRMQNGFICAKTQWETAFGVIGRDSSIAKKSLAAFLQDSGLEGEDRDGIVNTVLTSANGEVPTEKDCAKPLLVDQVDGFLDQVRFNDAEEFIVGGLVSDAEALESTSTPVMFPPRTDMDFTDRMWSFCSGATSYEDLSKTIKLISNALRTGDIQPMISKQNTTKLASIVRDCLKFTRTNISASYSQQQESLFSVLDAFVQSPLEYLVEIGITKLKRDYCFHLISSNLLSWKQLDPFLDPSLSLSDQINRLCELHQTLEIWSLPHVNVPGGFPHSCARTLVILALRYFQDGWKNECEESGEEIQRQQGGTLFEQSSTSVPIEFNVVLPRYQADVAKLVESVCQIQDPAQWRLVLTSNASQDRLGDYGKGLLETSVFDLAHVVQFSDCNYLFGESMVGDGMMNLGEYHIVRTSVERL